MDSTRSGFRRAAATSWALAGIGIAGVAGASALAYADTVKPAPAEPPIDVVEQAPVIVAPSSVPDVPPGPPVAPPPPPPTATPETTVEQAPTRTYTPQPTYISETTVEQAPATRQAPAPTTPRSTSTRRALTPTTVRAPNFSPQISRSRGS